MVLCNSPWLRLFRELYKLGLIALQNLFRCIIAWECRRCNFYYWFIDCSCVGCGWTSNGHAVNSINSQCQRQCNEQVMSLGNPNVIGLYLPRNPLRLVRDHVWRLIPFFSASLKVKIRISWAHIINKVWTFLTFGRAGLSQDRPRLYRLRWPWRHFGLLTLTTCDRFHQSIQKTRRRIKMNTEMILMDLWEFKEEEI